MNLTHPPPRIFDRSANDEPMRRWRCGAPRMAVSHLAGQDGKTVMGALSLADDLTESTLQASDYAQLRQTLRGEPVLPHDPGYDQARKVWNGMVDKRPAVVIYCAGSDDVISAVNFARS